jgi:hypothetical protein
MSSVRLVFCRQLPTRALVSNITVAFEHHVSDRFTFDQDRSKSAFRLTPTTGLSLTACSASQHEPLEESSSKVATSSDTSLPRKHPFHFF